ncbi:hypothetical protein [Candidatus Uabimicrobium sp. HlEnr_7]|uniref:hypothetical protein n=1 Tax=Candidatus Uabimicrobium helgolandensis TaxID=3095367 RepID=UPI0035569561
MKNLMLILAIMSIGFSENIYYLPEDTFFVATTTRKRLSSQCDSIDQITLRYDRHYFDSGDSWCGSIGNTKILYYSTKNMRNFLDEISQKYDSDENLYMFFYDPSFNIKKHTFAKNYNPNNLFQMRRYHSNTLKHDKQLLQKGKYDSQTAEKIKEMLAKSEKRFPLPDEAPRPLKTEKMTDDMLKEQVEKSLSLLEEKDWLVEEGWAGEEVRRLSKEEMIEQLEYRILNQRIIELRENSPHNIWVISHKDFTDYKEGKATVFHKWDGEELEEVGQQQPKPSLNVELESTKDIIEGEKFSLNIYIKNNSYVHIKKVKVTYKIPSQFRFVQSLDARKARYVPSTKGSGFIHWEVECNRQGGPIMKIELYCKTAKSKIENKFRLRYMGIQKICQQELRLVTNK